MTATITKSSRIRTGSNIRLSGPTAGNLSLFPFTNGPSAPAAFAGAFSRGVIFTVNASGYWFQGFRLWVAPGGDTIPQKCCLWQLTDTANGVNQALVPNSTVTSGTLTAGQWNTVLLPTPINLSAYCAYVACSGWTAVNGFAETTNQFGAGKIYGSGISNGALFAYSDQGGTAPEPYTTNYHQGLFGTTSADPTVAMPATGDTGGANFWIDVIVNNVPPVGAQYQLWPSQPYAIGYALDTATNFTIGTEIQLFRTVNVLAIAVYSPATVTQLPTACGVWRVSDQSLQISNLTPTWSGAAGSGWVQCTFSSTTLPAGKYKVTVFNGAGVPAAWNGQTPGYWAGAVPLNAGTNGIINGPISAFNNATADPPGQSSYHQSAVFTYPDTNVGPFNYWVDLIVS